MDEWFKNVDIPTVIYVSLLFFVLRGFFCLLDKYIDEIHKENEVKRYDNRTSEKKGN